MQRRAILDDLHRIIALLFEDDLGQTRENYSDDLDHAYIDAFYKIDADPNQYLTVVELAGKIVGTCHLTLIPSLTYKGASRLQIEAVRVAKDHRRQGIGEWMVKKSIEYGESQGALIVQLTTNKEREKAYRFYKCLGFEHTHAGMKYFIK